MYFEGYSKSAYPMHSGEQYRTVWSSGFKLATTDKSDEVFLLSVDIKILALVG